MNTIFTYSAFPYFALGIKMKEKRGNVRAGCAKDKVLNWKI
jgi:hypothetical protein